MRPPGTPLRQTHPMASVPIAEHVESVAPGLLGLKLGGSVRTSVLDASDGVGRFIDVRRHERGLTFVVPIAVISESALDAALAVVNDYNSRLRLPKAWIITQRSPHHLCLGSELHVPVAGQPDAREMAGMIEFLLEDSGLLAAMIENAR